MSLIKRKPWGQFFSTPFFDDFGNLTSVFERDSDEWFPAVNIIDNEKNYDVELAVPGFNKDDFNIDIEKNVLIISAESKQESEKEEKNYRRKEFSYSKFRRAFIIPENVDEDSIEAQYKDGLLKLKLNKLDKDEKGSKKHINVK